MKLKPIIEKLVINTVRLSYHFSKEYNFQEESTENYNLGILDGSVDAFVRKYENKSKCIFDQLSKLCFSLEDQPDIQILN